MKHEIEKLTKFMQLPPVTQIAAVVPDLEETVAFFQDKFFVGPFRRIQSLREMGYSEIYYKGKRTDCDLTFAFARLGQIEFEIIQPLYGQSIHRDFLASGRRGLHHLGFDLDDDLDVRLDALKKVGIEVLMSGRGARGAWAYLDTEQHGGMILELFNREARRA